MDLINSYQDEEATFAYQVTLVEIGRNKPILLSKSLWSKLSRYITRSHQAGTLLFSLES